MGQLPEEVELVVTLPSDNTRPVWTDNASIELAGNELTRTIRVHTSAQVGTVRGIEFPAEVTPFTGVTIDSNPLIIDIVQFELAFASTDVEAIEALTIAPGNSVQIPLSLKVPDELSLMEDEEVTVRVSLGGVELILLPEIIFTADNLVTMFTLEIPDSAMPDTVLDLTARAGLSGVEIASITVPVTISGPPREFELVFREQTDANEPGSTIDSLTVFSGHSTEVWLSLEGAVLADGETVTGTVSFSATDGESYEFKIVSPNNRILYRVPALVESGTLTVQAYLNQDGIAVTEFPGPTLQVNIVEREFRLVFDPSMISIGAGNSMEVTLTLESIVGELAEGEVVTVELPVDTTQEVWTDQSPITFTSEEMSTRVTVHATRRGGNPVTFVRAQFAPQPVAAPGVMVDSQPLSVSVIQRTFLVDLNVGLNVVNLRVEQGIEASYFIELRALAATQLFEDEAVTVRLVARGSDDRISEDIRINPIPASATLDDPSKASLAVDTVTEFVIQASPSASTGTYRIEIEVEISDVDGGTVSGRLTGRADAIRSSLYVVATTGEEFLLAFEVVPGPRRAFNLVFNEQTDANVPGSIIDSLTVLSSERVEVWLSLEGVDGAFLSDDESVTVNLSLLSDNNQFTVTDGSDAFDTVVLSASTDRVLITLDATANAGLVEAFSAEVTAMINSDQAGLPVADFNDASLSVSVVPFNIVAREFRLVFDPSIITITAGNSAEVTLTLESINGELAEGEVVTVELPTDTTQAVWTDQSPITFTSEEMSATIAVHVTRRGGVSMQASFAPQPVAVLGVMIDSQPLSVSVGDRLFAVDLGEDPNLNLRVEQGIAASYFVGFRRLTDTQLFEDEAVTVRLVAIGSDDMTSEDIRINPILAFATLDDPSKASLALNTVTEFLIQASPSASTGTYRIEIEIEISDVEGETVSGRLSGGDSINSSLYAVATTDDDRFVAFTVVPGPRREFNLVFNEQTDANVPGSIIDSLTVVAGNAAEVWLSLEGVGGAFLGVDESVTVSLSLSSDNAQFTATDGSDAFDTVVLTSTENGLITLDATASAGLVDAFSATVTAMVNPDQAGLPVADFSDASLPITIVPPSREFELVFREQTGANAPGSTIDSLTVVAGESAEVWLLLEGVSGAFLSDDESVTVNLSLLSDNEQFTATDGSDALDTAVLSAPTPRVLITLDATANAGLVDAFSAEVTATVDPDQAGLPAANFNDASLPVSVVPLREFNLVFSEQTDANAPGEIIDNESVFIGGTTPVWLSLEGVGGATLGEDESVEVSLSSDNAQFTVTDGSDALDTVVLSASTDRVLITLDATANVGEVAVMLTAAVDSDQAGLPAANFMDATLQVNVVLRQFRLMLLDTFFTSNQIVNIPLVLFITLQGEEGAVLFPGEEVDVVIEYSNGDSTVSFINPLTANQLSVVINIFIDNVGAGVLTLSATLPGANIAGDTAQVRIDPREFTLSLDPQMVTVRGGESFDLTMTLTGVGDSRLRDRESFFLQFPNARTASEFGVPLWQTTGEVDIDVSRDDASGRTATRTIRVHTQVEPVQNYEHNISVLIDGVVVSSVLAVDIVQFELAFASTDVEAIETLTIAPGDAVQIPLSLEVPDGLSLMEDEEVTVRVSLGGVELTLLPEIVFTAENLVTTFALEIPDSAVPSTLNLTARAGLSGVEIASITVPVTISEPPREFSLVFRSVSDMDGTGEPIIEASALANSLTEVRLSLEGASLVGDETVVVEVASRDNLIVSGDLVFSATTMSQLVRLDVSFEAASTAVFASVQASEIANANFAPIGLLMRVEDREFRLVFRSVDDGEKSGDPINEVSVLSGGSMDVLVSFDSIGESNLASSESLQVRASVDADSGVTLDPSDGIIHLSSVQTTALMTVQASVGAIPTVVSLSLVDGQGIENADIQSARLNINIDRRFIYPVV